MLGCGLRGYEDLNEIRKGTDYITKSEIDTYRVEAVVVAGQEVAAARAANVLAVSVVVAALATEFPKPHRPRAMHRYVDSRHLAAVCMAISRRVPSLYYHGGTDAWTSSNHIANSGKRVAMVS